MTEPLLDLPSLAAYAHRAIAPDGTRALREVVLMPGPERYAHLESHPLHDIIVKIKTPPITAALLAAQEAIKFRRPGLGFAADCRHGKTTMVTMVSEALGRMLPKVPYAVISAVRHDKPTEKAIWTDVLDGFKVEAAGTAMDRRTAAAGSILTACQERNAHTFALYIDEAQNWGALEFNFMRDFYNGLLQYHHKTLLTICVGDLKLKTVRDVIRASDKGLWSRFLRRVESFSGIASLDQLRNVMQEYDSIKACEYPAGSGICYSEFFAPQAFASGWRLAHEAPRLWQELAAVAKRHHRPLVDVGMRWIGESILTFLTLQMDKDGTGYRPGAEDWNDAVASGEFETTFF